MDSKLELNYEKLVEKAYEIFAADKKVLDKNVVENVVELFKQRLSNVLGEKYSKDLISYEINLENNIVKLNDRLSVLLELSKTENFETLINLLKRVKNIVKDTKGETEISENLFEKDEEKAIFELGNELEFLENEEFANYIQVLLNNANVINNYFDNVIINASDKKIKNNRIATLKKLENSIDKMINI